MLALPIDPLRERLGINKMENKEKCNCKNPLYQTNEGNTTKCLVCFKPFEPETLLETKDTEYTDENYFTPKHTEWEISFDKMFPNIAIDSEEEEGKINLYGAEKVKSFINSLLVKQREEVIKMVEGMQELEAFSTNDGYWQACEEIINKLKGE